MTDHYDEPLPAHLSAELDQQWAPMRDTLEPLGMWPLHEHPMFPLFEVLASALLPGFLDPIAEAATAERGLNPDEMVRVVRHALACAALMAQEVQAWCASPDVAAIGSYNSDGEFCVDDAVLHRHIVQAAVSRAVQAGAFTVAHMEVNDEGTDL